MRSPLNCTSCRKYLHIFAAFSDQLPFKLHKFPTSQLSRLAFSFFMFFTVGQSPSSCSLLLGSHRLHVLYCHRLQLGGFSALAEFCTVVVVVVVVEHSQFHSSRPEFSAFAACCAFVISICLLTLTFLVVSMVSYDRCLLNIGI